jgi:all-trans-8'-apo-beta-carotenal 15,15'-oxygenase
MAAIFSRRTFVAAAAATAAALSLNQHPAGVAAADSESSESALDYPWLPGFENLTEEHDYWVEEVDGSVPPALSGTLFRNGPGINKIGGQWLAHWFDGDGMLSQISFADGGVHYRNRYVDTPKHVAESKAGKILYRGFGAMRPGGWLANAFRTPGNASNTSVVYHADKLLTLWEGGPPYRLNPADLGTIGLDNFDGRVPVFSAHPKIDAHTGELYNFGMVYGPRNHLQIYRIARDGSLGVFPSIEMPYAVMNHDFAITGNYLVFCFGPLLLNRMQLILGMASFDQALTWQASKPTKILLVPRDRSVEPLWIDADPFFQFHFANAYDDGRTVTIDLSRYPDYTTIGKDVRDFWKTDWPEKGSSRMTRLTVDVARRKVESHKLAECPGAEFPRIDPRLVGLPHRYVYVAAGRPAAGHGFFQVLNKIDTRTGKVTAHDFSPNGYLGEPVFIPMPSDEGAEDGGYVVTLVLDAATKRTDVAVLDARDIAARPVATAKLTHHVPYGFHGFFTRQLFVTPRSI